MRKTWSRYPFFFSFVFILLMNPSPRLNANLLQRSEVVALINTLHRFSESLQAVDVFRRLWRESSVEESAKLVQEAERAVNTPVSYCTPTMCCPDFNFNIILATPAFPIC
jgi:hypothetical protein